MNVMISDEIPLSDTEDEADEEPAGTSIFDKQNEMSTSTLEPCQNGGNYNVSVFFRGLK